MESKTPHLDAARSKAHEILLKHVAHDQLQSEQLGTEIATSPAQLLASFEGCVSLARVLNYSTCHFLATDMYSNLLVSLAQQVDFSRRSEVGFRYSC